jgi:hypothetical protein
MLKSLISNILKLVRGKTHALSPSKTGQQPSEIQLTAVPRSKGGRPPVAFDEAKAMRLRQQGWSDQRIARHMHVAPSTVGSRLRNWKPPVLPPPPPPVQQAAAPTQRQPEPPAVALKPPTVSVAVPTVQQAPVPIPQVPASPIDNADDLLHRHEWLAAELAWRECFFLVNAINPLNLQFCNNNSQHGVAIDRWHESFRGLQVFENATKIWVVIDPADDNAAFLHSLVDDIWIRERCLVTVRSILDVAKYKTDACVGHKMTVENFEAVCGFKPMPQQNHQEIIRTLLEKPMPAPETPQQTFGGYGAAESWGIGGNAYQAPSGWTHKLPPRSNPDGSGHGNDGSGVCF